MTAEERQPVVYRIYDGTDRLIYIGASTNFAARLNSHRTQSWWYGLLERVETEPYSTREDAFAAEAEAIRSERPAFNLVGGKGAHEVRLSAKDLQFCREWAESGGPRRGCPLPLVLRRALAAANVRSAAA